MSLQRGAHDDARAKGQGTDRRDLCSAVALRHVRLRRIHIAWIRRHGLPVDPLGVVARHIHHVRLRRLDRDELLRRLDDRRAAIDHRRIRVRHVVRGRRGGRHANLLRALQLPGAFGALAHDLHCVEHIVRIVVVGLPQGGRPRKIAGHLVEHRPERGQRLDAGVPRLLVGGVSQRTGYQVCVLLEPFMGCRDLIGIGRTRHHLRHQLVGVKGDGCDQFAKLRFGRRRVGHGCSCHGLRGGSLWRRSRRRRGPSGNRGGSRRRGFAGRSVASTKDQRCTHTGNSCKKKPPSAARRLRGRWERNLRHAVFLLAFRIGNHLPKRVHSSAESRFAAASSVPPLLSAQGPFAQEDFHVATEP